MRTEGRKLETLSESGKYSPKLSVSSVLHLRLLEKNYMLFRDKNSLNALNNSLSEMKNLTPSCYECTPYIDALHNLMTLNEKSDSIVNELQATGNEFERITGEIARHEKQYIDSFFTLTQRLILLTLVLLCTLGPLFVYKTASYIAAPTKRLSDIIKKFPMEISH